MSQLPFNLPPIGQIRFQGLLPPVVRKPCFVLRKPAQVLYTLDDYVRDAWGRFLSIKEIIREGHCFQDVVVLQKE